jgi:hypothetical protein
VSDSRLNDLLVKPASDLVEQSKETLSKVFQELGGQDNAVATALKIFDAAKMNLPDMDLTEKLGDLAKLGAAPKLGDIATIGGDVATVGSDIARLSDDAAKLGGDVAKLGGDLAKLVSPNLFKTLKHDELGPTLRLLKGLNGAPKLSEIVPLPADPPQPREAQPERSPRDDRGARAVPPAPPENRKENEPAKVVEKGKEKGGEEPPVEGAKRQLGRGGEGKDGGDGAEKAAKAKRGELSEAEAKQKSKETYNDIKKHFGPFFNKPEEQPKEQVTPLQEFGRKIRDIGKPRYEQESRSAYLDSDEKRYLSEKLLKAHQELPKEEFTKLARQLSKDTQGWFKVTEKDGSVDKISFGDNGDLFRKSWEDKSQKWNDRIGDQFFNAGRDRNAWNGDYAGLGHMLNEAKAQMSPEEFKQLAQKLEKGTGKFIHHTENPDGSVKEVKVGDVVVHDDLGTVMKQKSTEGLNREVRQTKDGKYFVKGPDGVEREFVDSGSFEHQPPRNLVQPDGAIKNETGRPILAIGDGALRVVPPGHHNTGDYDAIIVDSNYQPVVLPNGRVLMPASVPPDVTAYKFGGLSTAVAKGEADSMALSGASYDIVKVYHFTNIQSKDVPAVPRRKE